MNVHFDKSNFFIISGSQDGSAKLFQISGLKVLNTFLHSTTTAMEDEDMELESTTGVESVGFSHEQYKWIATGGMDKNLKVWDISSGSCRVTCLHEGGVVSIKWHPNLPYVCSGSIDGAVRVWDARNGLCYHLFTGHSSMVTSVDLKLLSVEQGSFVVVSVSDDNTSRLFYVPQLQ
jgi:WD40 repeat protein